MAVNFKPVWLHCNVCFELEADQYKITNCGIIFCGSSKCLNVVTTRSCKNCKGPCQKHFNLDETAPREIRHLFTDILAQVKTIKRSEMFQKKQIASKLEADRGLISKQEMKIQKIEAATEKIIDRQKKVQDEIRLAERKEEALKKQKEMIKKKEEEELQKQREFMKKRKEEAIKKHEEMMKKKEEEALQRKRQLTNMSREAETLKRRRMEMKMEEQEVRRRMRMMKKGVPLSPHPGPGRHSLQLPRTAGGGGEVSRNTTPSHTVFGRDLASMNDPPSGLFANLNLSTSSFTMPSENLKFKSIFDVTRNTR